MTEIRFYHLRANALMQALPKLLQLTLARQQRAIVRFSHEQSLELWDQHLWKYDAHSFLPHALASDPQAYEQPIILTTTADTPNNARYEFLLEGTIFQASNQLMSAIIFSDDQSEQVEMARSQWKALKERNKDSQPASFSLSYWQQNHNGQWQQQA